MIHCDFFRQPPIPLIFTSVRLVLFPLGIVLSWHLIKWLFRPRAYNRSKANSFSIPCVFANSPPYLLTLKFDWEISSPPSHAVA